MYYELHPLVSLDQATNICKLNQNELVWDDHLYIAAQLRSIEISVFFSHTRPDGTDCFTVSDKVHGENIAGGYNSAKSVVDGWMNSDGHRANILNEHFTRGSIAVFENFTGTYHCQLFGY